MTNHRYDDFNFRNYAFLKDIHKNKKNKILILPVFLAVEAVEELINFESFPLSFI
jgi:hypothetical protein